MWKQVILSYTNDFRYVPNTYISCGYYVLWVLDVIKKTKILEVRTQRFQN